MVLHLLDVAGPGINGEMACWKKGGTLDWIDADKLLNIERSNREQVKGSRCI